MLVHDFAYGDLVFDGRKPESILATPGAREVASSSSRCRRASGWRAGGSASSSATREVVARVEELQDHLRAGIFMPVQHAAIAALRYAQEDVLARRDLYEARRDRVLGALAGTRLDALRCEGSYYVWIRLPEGVTATSLLVDHRVALAPGEGFGMVGRGWARLSLSVPDDRLDDRRRAAPGGVRLRTTAGRRSAPQSSLSDEARSSSGGPAAAGRGSRGGTRRPPRA